MYDLEDDVEGGATTGSGGMSVQRGKKWEEGKATVVNSGVEKGRVKVVLKVVNNSRHADDLRSLLT